VRCVREIEVVGFIRTWPAMALFVPIFPKVRWYFGGIRNACDLAVMWAWLAPRKGRIRLPRAIDRLRLPEGIDIKHPF